MADRRERIYGFAVEQYVDAHQALGSVARVVVVEAGVSLGPALELVKEIGHDLGERHLIAQLDAFGRQIVHGSHRAPARLAQVHHGPGVGARCQHGHIEHRLRYLGDVRRGWQVRRVVDLLLLVIVGPYPVGH